MKDPKHALDWFRRKNSSPKASASESTPVLSTGDALSKSGIKSDCAIDGFVFALDLAEQALDIAEVAPFIGPAAALLHKIIDSYKGWKDVHEKHDFLVQRVADITGDICATVVRMQETNYSDQIGRLRSDLEKYAKLIDRASQFIENYDNQGTLTRFAGRSPVQEEIDKLEHELDVFSARFGNNRLVDLCISQSMGVQALQRVHDMAVAEKLEKWFQSLPQMTQKQHDTEQLRTEGTGQWFLKHKDFLEWEDNPGVLWIEGPSGAGKSVISSTIIQELFAHREQFPGCSFAVAYFYFDFRNKETQSVEIALRRLILQLSAQSLHPYKTLDTQYSLSDGQKLPTYEELLLLLFKLIQGLGHTYIVLDALDECDSNSFQQLVGLVWKIKAWAETPLHLCITSQIRDIFTKGFVGVTRIALVATIIDQDIKSFITTELDNNSNLEPWQPHAAQVIEKITIKAGGMFRLASCLLIELSHCSRGEDEELNEILEQLPDTLMGIYDRFLQAIRPRDFPHAQAALQWIMYRESYINMTMLADAIAFDFSNQKQYTYKPNWQKSNSSLIPKWLAGLVQSNGNWVTLAHASVQDYLLSTHFRDKFNSNLNEKFSNLFIARCCISYLLYFGNQSLDLEAFETLNNHPLGTYAARHWYYHILRSDDQKSLLSLGMQLFQEGSKQYQALYHFNGHPQYLPPLHLCCSGGYLECALQLIENGANINPMDAEDSPLSRASYSGNIDIVNLLLEKGANINILSGYHGSPLAAASVNGKMDIVWLLLEKGANINLVGGNYSSPLTVACCRSLNIVQLFLEKGGDVNLVGGKYGSPLVAASSFGNLNIVQLLLKKGANINLVGGEDGTALIAACRGNKLEVVEFLLEKGANINKAGGNYGSALAAAAASEYNGPPTSLIHLLLEKGADIKAQGGRALEEAMKKGHEDVVALLKKHGAVLEEEDIFLDSVKYGVPYGPDRMPVEYQEFCRDSS
ncbi:HET-domain-containing protein [Mycena sanguinolenta]|uniref:HET-domain-containing protein n=1 Tax=Mycena sanguinolenta TaxID=230812 RepID=A0A8H6XZN5_9AGAR|nr:HET-domain-containing protein [Mycena sanguinolenta]